MEKENDRININLTHHYIITYNQIEEYPIYNNSINIFNQTPDAVWDAFNQLHIKKCFQSIEKNKKNL